MNPAPATEEHLTMKTLRIAEDLAVPLDVVTQTLAAIGRKGSGKTYLAGMIAEQMLDAAAQIVILDPVGNYWGLRVGADGRSRGKEVFVLGGDHGDVPLTPEAGVRIARLIVERRVSVVLDVSGFRIGERKRFAADLGEELFHLKKSARSPMHLFVEEAQLFAPQRSGPDEARMLGAFESIVRLGRNYGIGATLVTQRPQSVNKEVLSQVECLCVLQVNGAHERKALEEWVQEAGADRKLVGELPGLGRGEGYVWSPSWLRVFKRVRFAKKTTFDASATPEVGKETRAASLSAVDVDALRADLAEVVKKAEADDPRALRRRIQELERELAKKPAAAPAPTKVERVEVPVLKDAQVKRLEDALTKIGKETIPALDRFGNLAATIAISSKEIALALSSLRVGVFGPAAPRPPAPSSKHSVQFAERRSSAMTPPPAPAPRAAGARPPAEGDEQLGAGERRMLGALALRHPTALTRDQLGTLSGYAAGGGTFRTYLPKLRRLALVEERGGTIALTAAGLEAAGGGHDAPQTPEEVRETWRRALGAGERRMFDVLVEAYPQALSREELGNRSGFAAAGGTFRTYLPKLRRLGLADVDGDQVRATAELME